MTVKDLENMKNNDGLTMKAYKAIEYKSGYQVATEGKETTSAEEAIEFINEYKGNCGIWKSEGVYYIDKSIRVSEKNVALALGKACQQLSILKWSNKSLIWCQKILKKLLTSAKVFVIL